MRGEYRDGPSMSHRSTARDLHGHLAAIVDAEMRERSVPNLAEADWDRRVIQGEKRLADAVTSALDLLATETPVPTTDELFGEARYNLHGARSNWLREAAFKRRFRDEYPEPLVRAFLVPMCPLRRRGLDAKAANLLEENFPYVLVEVSVLELAGEGYWQALYADLEPPYETESYDAPYQSHRERKLEEIVNDPARSQDERLDAAEQIARIVQKRLDDFETKEQGTWIEGSVDWTPDPPGSYKRWLECRKHGIRHCSECGPRSKRRRKNVAHLEARFVELAREAGYDLTVLKTPPKGGRPSQQESQRIRTLASIAQTLNQEKYSLDAIGKMINRSRQSVSNLIKIISS
jgi:hypothetical protein